MFFVLAYAFSWAWVIPLAATGHTVFQGRGWPSHFPGLLAPMVAAFIVTAWTTSRHGVGDLVQTMGRWKIGWRWWIAALSPLAFLGLALAAIPLTGGTLPRTGDFAQFSGLPSSLVVPYVRDGTDVWIVPGHPERKTWWCSLPTAGSVEVRLAGEALQGRAVVVDGEHPEELRRVAAAYSRQLPRAARALGIERNGLGSSDTVAAASTTVVVHLELEGKRSTGPCEAAR